MNVKNLIFCFLALVFSCGLVAQSESQKPNILFIAIDDLKPTIGSFGDAFAQTPVMDALSKEATIFLNNHTQQAVCGPGPYNFPRPGQDTSPTPSFAQTYPNLGMPRQDMPPTEPNFQRTPYDAQSNFQVRIDDPSLTTKLHHPT